VAGYSKAALDRAEAQLRQTGFRGEIKRILIQHTIVSPPPRDEQGNIIGPAPPPYVFEYPEDK
jgi:hypothetical protein